MLRAVTTRSRTMVITTRTSRLENRDAHSKFVDSAKKQHGHGLVAAVATTTAVITTMVATTTAAITTTATTTMAATTTATEIRKRSDRRLTKATRTDIRQVRELAST